MIRVALVLVALFVGLHLVGARADVGILSGTTPASDWELLAGLAYALSWFGAAIAAPILVIASAIVRLLRRLSRRCGTMGGPVGRWIDSRQP